MVTKTLLSLDQIEKTVYLIRCPWSANSSYPLNWPQSRPRNAFTGEYPISILVVVRVHIPHDSERDSPRPERSNAHPEATVGTVEHCSCGLVGFLAAVVAVAVFYPTLVALTQPLHLLSSTALVALTACIWVAVWLVLEIAWEAHVDGGESGP